MSFGGGWDAWCLESLPYNLEELLSAQECKDGRIVTNEEQSTPKQSISSYVTRLRRLSLNTGDMGSGCETCVS